MASQFERTLKRGREEADKKLKIIAPKYTGPVKYSGGGGRSSGGGGGRSSASDSAAKIASDLKIVEEARTRAQQAELQRQALKEKKRILKQRAILIAKGARENVRTSRDARTGDTLRITTLKKGGDTIRKVENLSQGLVTYNQFAPGRGGGSVRQVGGVTVGATPTRKKETLIIPDEILDIKIDASRIPKPTSDMVYQGTIQNLQAGINKEAKQGKVGKFIITAANFVSGGAIEERRIQNEQAELNDRIVKFNKKYDGKELSESEFNKANAEQKFIESEQTKIDKKYNNLVSSSANKARNFVQKLSIQKSPRLTTEEQKKIESERAADVKIQAQIKKNQPLINKKESEIAKKQRQINSISGNSVWSLAKKFRLQNQINELRNEVAILRFEMPPKIIAGTFPIIPASAIPSGITSVRFLGVQKRGANGKIITDIVFKTTKGTTGVARGVTITKNGKTGSIVGGRMGKIAFKFPSGKKKTIGTKTFFGVERSTAKATKFTSDSIKKIAKFIQDKKKSGAIRIIKTNIQGLTQRGMGRIAVVKGKRFFNPVIRFPSGKIVKTARKYDLDDFASIAAVLTKEKISAIVGKTITLKGRRSEFAGIIKSLSGSAGSRVVLSKSDKLQYTQAMQKLFTSVAAAVSKAERSGQFATKKLILAAAAKELSSIKPAAGLSARVSGRTSTRLKRPSTKLKRPSISKTKVSVTTIKPKISAVNRKVIVSTQNKIKTIQKQISNTRNKSRQLSRQLSNTKSKQRSRLISRQISSTAQKQKQLQRQLQRLQNRLKTKLRTVTPTIIPSVPMGRGLYLPLPKIPKSSFKPKTLPKKQRTYYVVEKVRGKFKKLFPKPLTAKDAKDYAVYSIDNRLSKTAFFIPMGMAKKVVRPPKQIQNYYSRNSQKVRPYKIRFGKKKQMVNGFIEKRKYAFDKPGEKVQARRLRVVARRKISPAQRKVMLRNLEKARRARGISTKKTPTRRAVKRKISPAQRRELLKRLKRARAVRMRKLRKK